MPVAVLCRTVVVPKALCRWEPRTSQASLHGFVELCPIHRHPAAEAVSGPLCVQTECASSTELGGQKAAATDLLLGS